MAPLSLLSSFLSSLVASYPPSTLQSLYRRISQSLARILYDRLYLAQREWSPGSVRQVEYDLDRGFLAAARDAHVPERAVARGWDLAVGGATILGLPTTRRPEAAYEPSGQWVFAKVMQVVWSDDDEDEDGRDGNDDDGPESRFAQMMEDLGIGESLDRAEVRNLMRKRQECWH